VRPREDIEKSFASSVDSRHEESGRNLRLVYPRREPLPSRIARRWPVDECPREVTRSNAKVAGELRGAERPRVHVERLGRKLGDSVEDR
jgi:hypothetical protein